MSNELQHACHALKRSERAARAGDLKQAERWAKVAEQQAAAAAQIRAAEEPYVSAEEEAALRAELRARIASFAEADAEIVQWEQDYAAWQVAAREAEARRDPAPPETPLPACTLEAEARLTRIAKGEA
ncbi:MAG: hypothetical protein R3C25_11330 [Hyphomonadaceae bacterium]